MVLIYNIVQKSLFSFYMLVGIWKIENGNGKKQLFGNLRPVKMCYLCFSDRLLLTKDLKIAFKIGSLLNCLLHVDSTQVNLLD